MAAQQRPEDGLLLREPLPEAVSAPKAEAGSLRIPSRFPVRSTEHAGHERQQRVGADDESPKYVSQ